MNGRWDWTILGIVEENDIDGIFVFSIFCMHQKEIYQFQEKILSRYAKNKRDFPWRDSFDSYKVLVSETMSQQTQVDRVVPKFLYWMEQVPTLQALAELDKSTLLWLWSWLWFNSRAIRLQLCAQELVQYHGGTIPKDRDILLALPWIGPYTSASILAFAYNIDVPVVDTNIRRVLIRELWLEESASSKELEKIALKCLPIWQSNDRHNALMDYGSTIATAKMTWIKPTSKQSKFEGSARQVRWRVLKYLLENKKWSEQGLRELFPHKDFDKVLLWLAKDGIIQMNNWQVSIAE